MKYFFLCMSLSQFLPVLWFDFAGILKDVPDFPLVMIYNKEKDIKRLTLFPSLDYKGLHTVLVQLVEVLPMIQTGIDGT